jgi:polyphosphate kinase 2
MTDKLPVKVYERELARLQEELVKMEEWVYDTGARIAVVFEGRDAAGKGGAIKRMTEHMNPRITKHVALPKPTEREASQWYFQRYVAHLPAAGEIALFDRSWYNRAGVERVLGFCTPQEFQLFLRQCPIFERLLVEDGIILLKYWFSVSDEEQERRFRKRIDDPMRRWKLSETDLLARTKWIDYSRAKDDMFVHTDIPEAPWFVVEADDKRRARINCMAHVLARVPWASMPEPVIALPPRQSDVGYVRPPRDIYTYVPDHAATLFE